MEVHDSQRDFFYTYAYYIFIVSKELVLYIVKYLIKSGHPSQNIFLFEEDYVLFSCDV